MFAAATAVYFRESHPWWLYLLLALAPDLTMLGYLAGARVGAAFYDTAPPTSCRSRSAPSASSRTRPACKRCA